MREEWEEELIEAAKEHGKRAPAARAAGVHPDTVRYHQRRDKTFAARVDAALRSAPRRSRAWLLALCLLVPSALAATTITSSPVQLGATGLDLVVSLRRWQETAPDTWATYSNSGVTINDLGDGSYTVSGLPLATGTDRYAATLALDGDEDHGLFTYSWGAVPGVRIVWKEELELPSAPTTFKQGDTAGSLSLVVTRRLPAAACEPATTATFTVANAQTNVALFSNRSATISNCQLDSTTGTYGATFTYDIQSGDLATVAKYIGEFKICYSPTSCQTVPTDGRLTFQVVKRLGG